MKKNESELTLLNAVEKSAQPMHFGPLQRAKAAASLSLNLLSFSLKLLLLILSQKALLRSFILTSPL